MTVSPSVHVLMMMMFGAGWWCSSAPSCHTWKLRLLKPWMTSATSPPCGTRCVCVCVCVLVLLSCTNSWLCLGPRGAGAGLPAVRPLPDGVQRSDLLLLCESTSCYRRTTEHRRAFTAYYVFSWVISKHTKSNKETKEKCLQCSSSTFIITNVFVSLVQQSGVIKGQLEEKTFRN